MDRKALADIKLKVLEFVDDCEIISLGPARIVWCLEQHYGFTVSTS